MNKRDSDAEPYFSHPYRQLLTMAIVLGLVGFGAYVAFPRVAPVFLANPYLNGFIAFVFVIGVLACFWQVVQLMASVLWIKRYAARRSSMDGASPPRLMAPLATLLRARGARMQISAASARSILDSVATRIDELRDITRYIVNLLIFLGLLGTFYGLATTVPAVVETIRSLAPNENEGGIAVFNRLMTGLESQLGGMGIAFSSSLLGLAGSLVVGLLELFAGHGQNRFYRELEEWLSTITRFGFSSLDGAGPGDQDNEELGATVAALSHIAEQMSALQSLQAESDARQAAAGESLAAMGDLMERMAQQMEKSDAGAETLARIAESQERLADLLERQFVESGGNADAESRMRLRSIDVQLLRLLEEMAAGRRESTAELRKDIAALTKAMRQVAGNAGPASSRKG